MNCEKCGKELKPNAKFCPQCGYKRMTGTNAPAGIQTNMQARIQAQPATAKTQSATNTSANPQFSAAGGITDKDMYNRRLRGGLKLLVYFWYFAGVVMGILSLYLLITVFKNMKYLKYIGGGMVFSSFVLIAFVITFTVMLWKINLAIQNRDPSFLDMYFKTGIALGGVAILLWAIVAIALKISFFAFLGYVIGEMVTYVPAFAWVLYYFVESVNVYEYMGGDSYIKCCSFLISENPWLKYEVRANNNARASASGYDLSSIAETYRSPSEVRSDTWKCGRCGRTNANTVRTCACGVRKDQYYTN